MAVVSDLQPLNSILQVFQIQQNKQLSLTSTH
jgi:hypothetical protein